VFFGEKKITHVGMYVGDGRFINATTHTRPDVHEESLEDPYWVALYAGRAGPSEGRPAPGTRPAAVIQDPVLVFAYLAAVVALVFQVARRPGLRPLFDRLPALVWTYFLPMLSTTGRHPARGEPGLPRDRALPASPRASPFSSCPPSSRPSRASGTRRSS
jgi:hypothetical protein